MIVIIIIQIIIQKKIIIQALDVFKTVYLSCLRIVRFMYEIYNNPHNKTWNLFLYYFCRSHRNTRVCGKCLPVLSVSRRYISQGALRKS